MKRVLIGTSTETGEKKLMDVEELKVRLTVDSAAIAPVMEKVAEVAKSAEALQRQAAELLETIGKFVDQNPILVKT